MVTATEADDTRATAEGKQLKVRYLDGKLGDRAISRRQEHAEEPTVRSLTRCMLGCNIPLTGKSPKLWKVDLKGRSGNNTPD